MRKRFLVLGLLSPVFSFSQSPLPASRSAQAFVEAGGYAASGGQTPFWLRANQYGIVPLKPAPGFVRGGVVIPYRTARKRQLDWGAGADVVANARPGLIGAAPTILIPELYVKARLGLLEIYAGRRREIVGLTDSTLSSGSYAWSGNALPIPKIQLALREYAPIPLTNGILSVRGSFSHGWFPTGGFINNSFLHQSSLYGRVGKKTWPVRFYAGFNHQAQWGGQTDRLPSSIVENGGKLPSSFKDYIDVVLGSSLGYRSNVDPTRYSEFDRTNRIGNHLGSVDVAIDFQVSQLSVFAYRQSVYEDGSLYYFTNLTDGLHGLRIRNQQPSRQGIALTDVVLEYLNTLSQGGNIFIPGSALRGRDNYFNHQQYADGWSYRGQTIGTPFIPPANTTRYPQGVDRFTNNNRVQGYHVGLSGQIGSVVTFQTRLSYSRNYGTYSSPIDPDARQFSGGIWVGAPLSVRHGLNLTASVAIDKGNLYPESVGGSLSIRKTWFHDRDHLKGRFVTVDSISTPRPKPLPVKLAVIPVAKPVSQPAVSKPVTKPAPIVQATAKVPTPAGKAVPARSENSPLRARDFPVINPKTSQPKPGQPKPGQPKVAPRR
ncbi:MAG: hypothetical protein H7Z72_03010 [Bacteroidetes bacterium]|nr:hypothetical protein [Fibrella sp.]